MTHNTTQPEVTQADRDAAADLYLDQLGDEDGFAERIRGGTNLPDCNAWEMAFARHRITAEQSASPSGLVEATAAIEAIMNGDEGFSAEDLARAALSRASTPVAPANLRLRQVMTDHDRGWESALDAVGYPQHPALATTPEPQPASNDAVRAATSPSIR